MTEKAVRVGAAVGLHARPAALLVQAARAFASDLKLQCNGKAADAKSIVGVLSLAAGRGAAVTITATGVDEAAAVETLAALIESESGFSENGIKENSPC